MHELPGQILSPSASDCDASVPPAHAGDDHEATLSLKNNRLSEAMLIQISEHFHRTIRDFDEGVERMRSEGISIGEEITPKFQTIATFPLSY